MKTMIQALVLAAALAMSARAEAQRIEASATVSPVFVGDPALQAFAENDPLVPRIGADVRVNVLRFAGFDLLPLISYRFGAAEGTLGPAATRLEIHDLAAGLRLRREITPFMSFFAEASAGLAIYRMTADLVDGSSSRSKATDDDRSWEASGGIGLALGPSREFFSRRGIQRFSFGGELCGGYQARGDFALAPRLAASEDNELEARPLTPWGSLDPSGWYAQIAFTVRFL